MANTPLAEMSPQARMIKELQDVAASDTASMFYTTTDPDTGEMHSCITWYAPLVNPSDDEVKLYTLSAPGDARIHSANIEAWERHGNTAPISGAIREDGQVKNDPKCHGITSLNGEAVILRGRNSLDRALGAFAIYDTFDEKNLAKYFGDGTETIPTHYVIAFLLRKARVFDGRLGDDNPDRLVNIGWTAGLGWSRV